MYICNRSLRETSVNTLAKPYLFPGESGSECEGVLDDLSVGIDRSEAFFNDDEVLAKDTSIADTVNLDLHGGEAVDIVRLICNTYAKENK